jgi:hypothetical protein
VDGTKVSVRSGNREPGMKPIAWGHSIVQSLPSSLEQWCTSERWCDCNVLRSEWFTKHHSAKAAMMTLNLANWSRIWCSHSIEYVEDDILGCNNMCFYRDPPTFRRNESTCSLLIAGFLLDLLFERGDEDDRFLRNFDEFLPDYVTLGLLHSNAISNETI